jgi:sugar transferase (PEP-CTERM/EpsH1 system associated)
MKLLFIAPYLPSSIRVRPYHFVRELSRRHEVSLLAVGSEREASTLAELRTMCRSVETVPLVWPVAITSMAGAAVRGDPLQSAVCQSPRFRQSLRHLMTEEQFDLVHIEHLRAAQLHASMPCSVPIVYDSVDSISLLLERTLRSSHSPRQRLMAAIELRRTSQYERRLMSVFDAVVITSNEDADALRQLAPTAPITTIPNGVDLNQFRPFEAPPEPATLVFSGKMSYHANASAVLHFVRDILPHIRARRPDVRLRIVGSNPPAAIQALARDPAILVTGYVPDMRAAVKGATVAICPVTVKVGIQNKILESMALGLPVVTSTLGAHGIGAVSGRDLLVADDSRSFADMVGRLLSDVTLRASIATNGRRYVESHHRWDRAVCKLEEVYATAARLNHAATPNRPLDG